ncbi:hydroxysteroid 11-beta-dehydrogenase 1-like protein isoform X7 [Gallus gallus]|uniref:hydroxysteroid 11-beta-dehydrogenase 1-like protein isoform X7 n=1 Tax=Gallus gallus TaxID=9031 RepID=UPI001AE84AED|nr:hydroxysteroid 11-beta-dehydrogenase 1-like protein isoform X7 [Gallus gallus]
MMKPFGKVLCAAGSLAVLLAFFWRDTFQPEQLSGARVLLTGASAGIGEQMAYHYATFGAEIVLTARREAVLQEVMKKCLTLGAKKVFYIPADMSSPSEPDRVVQFAVQNLGGLDYLVLNHIGVSPFQMWGGDVEHTRWLMQLRAAGLGLLRVLAQCVPCLGRIPVVPHFGAGGMKSCPALLLAGPAVQLQRDASWWSELSWGANRHCWCPLTGQGMQSENSIQRDRGRRPLARKCLREGPTVTGAEWPHSSIAHFSVAVPGI